VSAINQEPEENCGRAPRLLRNRTVIRTGICTVIRTGI
jgi:hypothetical protein